MSYYEWRPYVSVGARRREAKREMERLRKKGHPVSPVVLEGRRIARSFWGLSWCENLERYSDYANRLPRGRTYVRNGSVVDLQIARGKVTARVAGSELYEVTILIEPVGEQRWSAICADCAGGIDSMVELLQGRFAKGVMQRICEQDRGLFPSPREIKLACSCPDWAEMCKHVAATMYGIGARLDEKPELLFRLRQVDEGDLLAAAGRSAPLQATAAPENVLADPGLAELFGLELAQPTEAPATELAPPPAAPAPRTPPPALANERSRKRASRSAAPPRGRDRQQDPAGVERRVEELDRAELAALVVPLVREALRPYLAVFERLESFLPPGSRDAGRRPENRHRVRGRGR